MQFGIETAFLCGTLRPDFARFAVLLVFYRKGRKGFAKGRKGPKANSISTLSSTRYPMIEMCGKITGGP